MTFEHILFGILLPVLTVLLLAWGIRSAPEGYQREGDGFFYGRED